jgi:hypothetical protein
LLWAAGLLGGGELAPVAAARFAGGELAPDAAAARFAGGELALAAAAPLAGGELGPVAVVRLAGPVRGSFVLAFVRERGGIVGERRLAAAPLGVCGFERLPLMATTTTTATAASAIDTAARMPPRD